MNPPRVICLGMNEESALAISKLIDIGADIVAVAGLPVEGAEHVSDFVDLSAIAATYDLEWLPLTDINSEEALAAFEALQADMLFVLGWSQLLGEATLSSFPMGVIGSHPSALPYGRGRAPVAWTILEGRSESAVSLFRMGTGVDDGTVLRQMRFEIPPRATARVVYDLVSNNLALGFCELYSAFKAGAVPGDEQDDAQATWRARRVPADGCIDFRWSSDQIDRLVRAVSEPYPGAYSYFRGERAVFQEVEIAAGEDLRRKGGLGQVLAIRSGRLLVQTGDLPLWLGYPDFPDGLDMKVAIGDFFGFRLEDEVYALRQRVSELESGTAWSSDK